LKKTPTQLPRIAIVSYYYHHLYGGLQTQLRLLARHLKRSQFPVTVFTSRPASLPAHEVIDGVDVHRFGSAETRKGIAEAYDQIRNAIHIAPFKFDVLYTPLGTDPKYPLEEQLDLIRSFTRLGKPTIIRFTSSGRVTALAHAHPKALTVLHEATKVVALNSDICSELTSAGFRSERIFHVPNSVDTSMFSPAEKGDVITRRRQGGIVFITSCRLTQKKHLDDLIREWTLLAEEYPTCRHVQLQIIGDDNSLTEDPAIRSSLFAISQQIGTTIQVGRAFSWEKMPQVYRDADIFISYSLQEGMSNSTLEAMASGLPVIVPATEAYLPLVRNSDNFVFHNRDDRIVQLRRAFRSIDDYRSIGANNRARIVEHYQSSRVMPRILQMIRTSVWESSRDTNNMNLSSKVTLR